MFWRAKKLYKVGDKVQLPYIPEVFTILEYSRKNWTWQCKVASKTMIWTVNESFIMWQLPD